MVRNYVKKSQRGIYGNENLQAALQEIQYGKSLKSIARKYKIPVRTLSRQKDGKVNAPGAVNY